MNAQSLRPRVSDLVFQLYGRPLHPELFDILAVDTPSGLDADTGVPMGITVRAEHTVTFVAPKIGFNAPAAAPWLGQVHVADIGVALQLAQRVGP